VGIWQKGDTPESTSQPIISQRILWSFFLNKEIENAEIRMHSDVL
jgi:hypothetical protein